MRKYCVSFTRKNFSAVHSALFLHLALCERMSLGHAHSMAAFSVATAGEHLDIYVFQLCMWPTDSDLLVQLFSSTWLVFRHCRTPSAAVTCRSTFWIIMRIIAVRMPRRCFCVKRDWKIDFPAMKIGKNLSHPKSWQKINNSRGLVGFVRKECHQTFKRWKLQAFEVLAVLFQSLT